MAGSGLAYDIMDASATLAARAAFANKTDNSAVVPESDWGTVAGAGLFDLYDDYFIDINEFFRGTKYAPGPIGINRLPSGAHASGDNLVIGGEAAPGISLIDSGTTGTGSIIAGDSGSNNRGMLQYQHTTDVWSMTAGATPVIELRSGTFVVWPATHSHYSANAQIILGTDPGSLGNPSIVLRKSAGGSESIFWQSDEGSNTTRSADSLDASENRTIGMYNASGVLQATHQFTAASADFSLGGGRFTQSSTLTLMSPVTTWHYASGATHVLGAEDAVAVTLQASSALAANHGAQLNLLGGAVVGTNKNGGPVVIQGRAGTGTGTHGTVKAQSTYASWRVGDTAASGGTNGLIAANEAEAASYILHTNSPAADAYAATNDPNGVYSSGPGGTYRVTNGGSATYRGLEYEKATGTSTSGWTPSKIVTRTTTADATVTTLFEYVLVDESLVGIDVLVTAKQDTTGKRAIYIRRGGAYRDAGGGATPTAGGVVAEWTDETTVGWDCTIDTNANSIRVRVTGEAATNITWTADVRIVESR